MTLMFDSGGILQEEIRHQSFVGVRGLNDCYAFIFVANVSCVSSSLPYYFLMLLFSLFMIFKGELNFVLEM